MGGRSFGGARTKSIVGAACGFGATWNPRSLALSLSRSLAFGLRESCTVAVLSRARTTDTRPNDMRLVLVTCDADCGCTSIQAYIDTSASTGYVLGVRCRLCRDAKLDGLGFTTCIRHHASTPPSDAPSCAAPRNPGPGASDHCHAHPRTLQVSSTRKRPQPLPCTRTSRCWACLHALAA